jgi:DNA-binding response OmpR family regulator
MANKPKKEKPSSGKDENGIQNQAKILIIDDEIFLRKSVKKILEKSGFYCETAMDYETAKKCVGNLDFDLLLVDIVLPKMSGLQLIKKLQEECNLTGAIIFITGEPNLETSMKAIRIGATDYLEKPVERKQLVDAIHRSLIRREKEIRIIKEDKNKVIVVNEAFLSEQEESIKPEFILEVEECLNHTHDALLQLKKKYGKEFNEEQRSLMNIIAQSNSRMKKTLKKQQI